MISFPFAIFLRDLTAFLLAAPSHGGVMSYYREAEENERAVICRARLPSDHRAEPFCRRAPA